MRTDKWAKKRRTTETSNERTNYLVWHPHPFPMPRTPSPIPRTPSQCPAPPPQCPIVSLTRITRAHRRRCLCTRRVLEKISRQTTSAPVMFRFRIRCKVSDRRQQTTGAPVSFNWKRINRPSITSGLASVGQRPSESDRFRRRLRLFIIQWSNRRHMGRYTLPDQCAERVSKDRNYICIHETGVKTQLGLWLIEYELGPGPWQSPISRLASLFPPTIERK